MISKKPRAFISFWFDEDKTIKELFVWQIRLKDSPFEFEDWSAKKPWDEETRKDDCEEKMKKCDLVLVVCWPKTHNCSGVKTEIKIAHKIWLKVFWIDTTNTWRIKRPEWIDKKCPWRWNDIKDIYIKTLREKNEQKYRISL